MSRHNTDQLLATVTHRLEQLDAIGHRVLLLESVNNSVADMSRRLAAATVDVEAISALAVNVRSIVGVVAARLDAIEMQLSAIEVTLANRLHAAPPPE